MERKVYTREIHIERLKEMMTRPNPCRCCPAAPSLDSQCSSAILWQTNYEEKSLLDPCIVCREFIGLTDHSKADRRNPYDRCPCHVLGKEVALILTAQKLEGCD